ncbi:MAG TPA: hypothetical protein ENK72_01160 [Epsilonproteobacteria bacterium]|nr:hypothetical protein [Campylobacterota bacterium]
MKNRLLITISDINGSKQYSVHEVIKKVILITLLILALIAIGTFLYIKYLNQSVSSLNEESQKYQDEIVQLKQKSEKYKQTNKMYHTQNEELILFIKESGDKLDSLNEKLHEVEDMIGIGPDIDLNTSFHTRLQMERAETSEKVRKKVIEEQLSTIQKTILLNSIPNGKPLTYKRISSKYGYRKHPATKKKSFHPAVDLTAPSGTPVYAPANGVVVFSGRKGAYGNFLLLAHSYGFKTAYGHLKKYVVKSGQYVTKGELIAYVGSTGRSTGPHLHYEVRYLDKWINPEPFMEWRLEKINDIRDKITKVDWSSILLQTNQLITLSTSKKESNGFSGQ